MKKATTDPKTILVPKRTLRPAGSPAVARAQAGPAAGWLYKTEPSVYSVADLKREGRCRWDGVRNYLARNFLRQAQVGDPVALWHSNIAQPGLAGLGRICKAPYADPTALDPKHAGFDEKSDPSHPRWFCVEVEFVAAFPHIIAAKTLKADPACADLLFFKQGRLSVCPASPKAWKRILALGAAAL